MGETSKPENEEPSAWFRWLEWLVERTWRRFYPDESADSHENMDDKAD